ncbi:MAG: SPOR domain-containing protein [Phycisphaerales bacterium JB060]
MVDRPLTLPQPHRGLLTLVLGLAALMLHGCASGGTRGGYREYYEAGQYQTALAKARATAGQPGGTSEAALVAGLSAEAMRDDATARAWLEPIARGSGDLAPRAQAGLALIELRTGDPLRAARQLEAASGGLTGFDAREAARVAAEAYDRAGRDSDAQRMRRRAAGMYEVTSASDPSYAAGGYTIQLGAYSTRSRATQRITEVSSATRTGGVGEPRIEVATRDGRMLYLVHVGRFRTQGDAERARRTLGVSAIVVNAI